VNAPDGKLDASARPDGARRGTLALVLAGAAALGLGGLAYYLTFVRPEAKSERPAAAGDALFVAEASGGVEIAGPDGVFRPVKLGERLGESGRLRAGDDGSALLSAPDGSTVRLYGGTTVEVALLRRELGRLRLRGGMIEADVRDDPGRVLEVVVDEDGAVARTRGARFLASSDGKGATVVGARRGEVVLKARGREVVIHAGEQSRIAAGAPPEPPTRLPDALLLEVVWPQGASNRKELVVEGTTAPGARVKVAGRWTTAGPDGSYRRPLSLDDGTHRLEVLAVDVAGHEAREESPPIVIDTRTDFQVHPPKWK
jgi:hypothetical protein